MNVVLAISNISYSVEAACAATCIGRHTIDDAIKNKELVVHYVGRKTVIRSVDLDEWIQTLPTERPR